MPSELKIKIKSLAAEARIIRAEERKYLDTARTIERDGRSYSLEKGNARTNWAKLRQHRLELRVEQRATLLAYGFIRGRDYRQIEPNPHYLRPPRSKGAPDWGKVRAMIWKYSLAHRPSGVNEQTGKEQLLKALYAWRDAKPEETKAMAQKDASTWA